MRWRLFGVNPPLIQKLKVLIVCEEKLISERAQIS